ncbi:MAG: nuclear transport factor 2 family protein [Candidatus Sulfotelmatobacter sp.]
MKTKVLVLAVMWLASLRGWSQIDAEQARILMLENAWNQAVQGKDSAALELLLGRELVYLDYDGKLMNKAEYMASVQSRSLRPGRIVSDSMNVHLYGATAVVNGAYRETGLKNGRPYVLREQFIDTWVRRGENWVCVASGSTLVGQ